jgi:hypothetical protein
LSKTTLGVKKSLPNFTKLQSLGFCGGQIQPPQILFFWVFVGCGQATFDIDSSLALPQKHKRKQKQ